MNEVANYNMQDLMNLMGKQMTNVTALADTVRGIGEDVKEMRTELSNVNERMDFFENNIQVTDQQRRSIRRAANRRVYEILGITARAQERTLEERIEIQKYSPIFHQRLYSETSRNGHLSSPYGETLQRNYDLALKDIEAWSPSNGVTGLKKEADDNAIARKVAESQGY